MSEIDRPGPGEELNTSGPEVPPRQAASVVVLRGGADDLELLLVKRNPEARFMGGAWVFPGGAVDAHEGEGDEAHRVCAVRELEEEAAVRIADPAELVPFSRWITPAEVKIRFDTWFFVVRAPEDVTPAVDGEEVVDLRWIRPQAALDELATGGLELVFPTIKHLEQLAKFDSVAATIEAARRRDVVAVQPRIVDRGEGLRVLLPGEPGFDE